MPPASYESLQSDIEKQQSQIVSQRETIRQQKIVGSKSLRSLKRVHPKLKPSVYFGQVKPQIEQVKGRITQLETAEKELGVAEQKLIEQEQLLEKRKAEGYKVRETAEGIEFFKQAPTPKKPTSPYGNVQRTETHEGKTIAIHYDTGITVYPQQHMIKIPGEPFQKLPSHPEFQPVMLDRHTSVERHLVNWFRGKQEQERLDVIAKTETRILTEAEIDKLLAGKTQSEKLAWYKKTAEFGIEGEEKRPWSEIKKEHPDWKLTIKDGEPVIETPETIEQAKFETHKESLRKRITAGTPVERLQEFTKFVSSAFIKPLTVVDIAARGLYGEGEKALDIWARQSFEFKEKDVPEIFVESYKPGGYGFFVTVGALFQAGMAGIGKAGISAAGTKTGTVLAGYAKYAPFAIAGTFSATYGADIGLTAAREEVSAVPKGETLSKIFGGVTAISLLVAGGYLAGKPFTTKPIWKRTEVISYKMKGLDIEGVSVRKYVDVFGKKLFYGKGFKGVRDVRVGEFGKPKWGYDPKFGYEPITPEVPSRVLAQSPIWKPTKISSDIIVSQMGTSKVHIGAVGTGAVMRTGITPGSLRPLVLRETGYLAVQKSQQILDLFTKRMNFASKYFTKGMEWQPKTGIGLPEVRDITGRVVPYVPPGERVTEISQLEKIFGKKPFKLKPAKDIVTRIDVSKDGIVSVEKYGRQFIDVGIVRMPKYDPLKAVIEGKFILRKPKPSIAYEPYYRKFIAKGMEWQPKTGIGLPEVRDITGRVVPYVPPGERVTEISQLEKIFGVKKLRLRPKKPFDDVIYRITPSAEIWMGKEFYRGLGWKPKEGIPLPGIYTGRQPILRPTAEITPVKPRVHGRIVLWDWLTYKSFLETGVPAFVRKPLVKLRVEPKKRIFTLKDIIKDQEHQLKDIGGQMTQDGQILILKPVVKTKQVTLQKQIEKQIKISEQIKVSKPKQIYRQRFEMEQRKMFDVEKINLGKTMLSLFPSLISEKRKKRERIGISSLVFESATEQMQMQRQASVLLFGKPSVEIQEQMQMQEMIYEYPEVFKFVYPTIAPSVYYPPSKPPIKKTPREEPPKEPPIKPPPAFMLPDTPYKLFGHTTGQGYKVKVKERQYFKGKKKKPGRLVIINKRALSKDDAKSLLFMTLDNSAAASGNIIPVNEFAKEPRIRLTDYRDLEHKFYWKEDRFIERRKNQIDTRGEVEGISALGWYSHQVSKAQLKKEKMIMKKGKLRKAELKKGGIGLIDIFGAGRDEQGFNVEIMNGKSIKINKNPISFRNAWALRGMILDNSIATSGKIVPAKAMAQEPSIELSSFEDISHKFDVKGDILVEKKPYRMDTSGEKKGLSAMNLYKQKSKKQTRVRQPVDMFDTGMDDMLINMDKVFKGVFNFGF